MRFSGFFVVLRIRPPSGLCPFMLLFVSGRAFRRSAKRTNSKRLQARSKEWQYPKLRRPAKVVSISHSHVWGEHSEIPTRVDHSQPHSRNQISSRTIPFARFSI